MKMSDAVAILEAMESITTALDTLERKLSRDEIDQFRAYYGVRMRNIAQGNGYGSMPIGRALRTVEGGDEC